MMHEQFTLFSALEECKKQVGWNNFRSTGEHVEGSGVGLSIRAALASDISSTHSAEVYSFDANGECGHVRHSYVKPKLNRSFVTISSGDGASRKQRKCPPLKVVEGVLRRASIGAQLLAALAYDSGISARRLLSLQARDIHLTRGCLNVGGKEVPLSKCIADDLRSFLFDKICGYDASTSGSGVLQSVFSEEDVVELVALLEQTGLSLDDLHVVGRLHLYITRRRKGDATWRKTHTSPLSLFEKGPMIVRRGYGGAIRAYYLWRRAV